MSREYIVLSTFEQKLAFLGIYKPKRARNRLFFRRFRIFRAAWKAYLTSMTPSTTTPGPGAPPVNTQRGRDIMQNLPLFYWLPEKSYMTSSRTATLIYIAARFRVNGVSPLPPPSLSALLHIQVRGEISTF
jgi:hypothetical protein